MILAGAVILAGCAGTRETIDRNVLLFDETAFGGPFDNDVPQNKRLVKWAGDIRVAISGDPAGKYTRRVKAVLRKVSALTGLRMDFQPEPDARTNYLVQFINRERVTIRNEHVGCLANVRERHGVIYRARVVISTADESAIPRCLAHETMHSVGFRFHSAAVRSILSPVHNEPTFTRWDALMLKTLYDGRLTPDMPRTQAIAQVRQILETALSGQ